MQKKLLTISRWGAGVLALNIVFGFFPPVIAATTVQEIAPSSISLSEAVIGDISAPTLETQITDEQTAYDKLINNLVASLGADQAETVRRLSLQPVTLPDEPQLPTQIDPMQEILNWLSQDTPLILPGAWNSLQNWAVDQVQPEEIRDENAVTEDLSATGSLWQRLGAFFRNTFIQIKSYFVSPSQASENCRDAGAEGACKQAESLKNSIETAKEKQATMREALKQAVSDWGTSNREAYKNLSTDKWTEKCLDAEKRFCYKQSSTGTKVLPDGSMYDSAGKNLGGQLVRVESSLRKHGVTAPGTTLLDSDQARLTAARKYINSSGPTLEDYVLQKVASIACELGVKGDGLFFVKKGKVYFRPNPADNLCAYPLGSDRGQEILRNCMEFNRQVGAYLKNVEDGLERQYRQSLEDNEPNHSTPNPIPVPLTGQSSV